MGKLKETLLKTIEDIEQTFQKAQIEAKEVDLPTPEEVAAKFEAEKEAARIEEEKAAAISPIIQMAIEQRAAALAKDIAHGIK